MCVPNAVEESSEFVYDFGNPGGEMESIVTNSGRDPGEDPERVIRQERARRAVAEIRQRAQFLGLDKMSPGEIDAEIRAARAERTR